MKEPPKCKINVTTGKQWNRFINNNHLGRGKINNNNNNIQRPKLEQNPVSFVLGVTNGEGPSAQRGTQNAFHVDLKIIFKNSPVCKQKQHKDIKNTRSVEEDLGALYLGSFNNTEEEKPQPISWEVDMPVKNSKIYFKIDTGADVTVISVTDLPKLGITCADIRPTHKKLRGPSNQALHCIGYTVIKFRWGENVSKQIVYICKGLTRALLGKPAINSLKIVTLSEPGTYSCSEITSEPSKDIPKETQEIISRFPEVFQGLGKVKGDPIHIKMKDDVTPYRLTAPRRMPIPMLKAVEAEIARMEELGVIRKVDNPTDWCHPIVVVPKPSGAIRICIDLTKLNKGIERELYQLESVEETIA